MHHPIHVLDAPVLTLPGENWSPPGKRPRKSYMTNLDGLCQGGPEGGKYIQKLPGLVKRPKNKQKGSREESCESLTQSALEFSPIHCPNGRLGQDLGFGGFAFALKLPELLNRNLAAVRANILFP